MKKPYLLLVLLFSLIITNCGSSKSAIMVDPHIGTWSLSVEGTPQGDVSATMTITKNSEGNYSGTVNSDVGQFNLDDVKIVESKLSAGFMIQGTPFDLIGNFEKLLFEGYVSGMGEEYPTNGKKIVE